ncbi:MAG: hypothetical protein HYR68_04500 [Burkholderiales bacterium]|nr:hypothetical protein [Burkholderiales bacterium]MBI3731618.1 hypothetical protein [Burkholderiales bacterium]
MHLITNETALNNVSGGLVGSNDPTKWDASETHTSGENSWGQSYKNDTAGTGSFSNVLTITVLGTDFNFFGGAAEGLAQATVDCLKGAGALKTANDLAANNGSTGVTSAQAALVGCTVGVGAGILRDMNDGKTFF